MLNQWRTLETKKDYEKASARFEEINDAPKGTPEHQEKLLLALLINQYEEKRWSIPKLEANEIMKIRMEEFGYIPKSKKIF